MGFHKKLTSREEFDRTIKKGVCLIDFKAVWCGPCKTQEPIISKLAANFQGQATIATVDVDQNLDTAARYQVQSIPTLILFKNGIEIQRFIGLQSENILSEAIAKTV